jgi:hypothetical protein
MVTVDLNWTLHCTPPPPKPPMKLCISRDSNNEHLSFPSETLTYLPVVIMQVVSALCEVRTEILYIVWMDKSHCSVVKLEAGQHCVGYNWPTRFLVGNKNGNLALQVVRVKIETIKYAHESLGTRTRETLHLRGPTANVNYRSTFSSKRTPHNNKPATV